MDEMKWNRSVEQVTARLSNMFQGLSHTVIPMKLVLFDDQGRVAAEAEHTAHRMA